MSKVKHTPGPWRLKFLEQVGRREEHPEGFKVVYDLDQPNDRGQRSAGTLIVFGNEGEANAHLIAAAPELLDALKLIVDGLQLDNDEEVSGADVIEYLSIHWQQLKAAIAKAEGKEG